MRKCDDDCCEVHQIQLTEFKGGTIDAKLVIFPFLNT